MMTFEGAPVGEIGLFKKKKKKKGPPPPPPPPPTPATPESSLFVATQAQAKANAIPWFPITLITAGVLVIGVSLFLIFKKPKKA